MFKINDKVYYLNNNNKRNSFEIINAETGINMRNSNYVFGYDNDGFPLNSFEGKFDFILAEYDSNGNFIKNIACESHEITNVKSS